MKVFKSNTTRIVIACFIIFMAIPFIFVESSGGPRGKGPSIPMEQSGNPLSKIIDRIGTFYGFKKRPARSSFDKKGDQLASAKMIGGNLPASLSSAEAPSLPQDEPLDFGDASAPSAMPAKAPAMPAGKLPQVKEYIRMDGDTFEVVTDPAGRKFVAMPDGFVPYEKLMADTISQEDFDAARAQAPELEDWEIFEALRSPGGLPAYLASGGNSAFYKDSHPGYYDREGKEGSKLFGMRSSGRMGRGDDGDIYDERKLDESIASNKGRVSGGGSVSLSGGMRGKYIEAKKAEEQNINNAPKDLASLVGYKVVIGEQTITLKDKNNAQRSSFDGNVSSATKETLKLKDESVNSYMADIMNANFESEDAEGNILKNQWVYPDEISFLKPGYSFISKNPVFNNKRNIVTEFNRVDELYKTNRNIINRTMKEALPRLKIAVIDGFEENGKVRRVKAVKPETFHYKIVSGLIDGRDIASGEYIDIQPNDKADTLLVVSDRASLDNLKSAGYNVVLFNKFAITPSDTEAFYSDALETVKNMASAKKATKQASYKEVLAKTSDINKANVGVRGI